LKFVGTLLRSVARSWAGLIWNISEQIQRRAKYDTVEINMAGGYPERRIPSSPLDLMRPGGTTHRHLLEMIDHLAVDPKVKRVIVSLGAMNMGLARLQEIARALDRLRAAGKELVATMDSTVSTRDYLLAACCERRVMAPSAMLSLTGLSMELTFFKGLLDKADVEPDLLVAGKFKSATEPFTRKSSSEAAREMTEGLLDELFSQLTADLAESLGKSPAQVKKLIDGGPYTAERAAKAGLIDKVQYRDELLTEQKIKESRIVRGGRYQRFKVRHQRRRARMTDAPAVALVHVTGTIREGRGDPSRGVLGAKGYVKLFRRLRKNKDVGAVVVRISSPGGAAGGSDLMRRELARLVEKKPVIVSLGDVAASGGYMLAVAGKTILTERGTLTGSIGVIGGKFDVSGLLAKFGIGVESHHRGEAAGIFSGTSKFNKIERRRMTEIIGATYASFKTAVAEGRGLSEKKVQALAEGRVWTGREALAKGMVDDLGGIGEALRRAKKLAGGVEGEPVRLLELPALPSPFKMMMSLGDTSTRLPAPLGKLDEYRELARGPFAGLPFSIRIK
jgi:protease IV